jgi:ubiquinone/menaquinone biosynthesis C-methylase UbiE
MLKRVAHDSLRTFAEFTGIREGVVLDVGCGPGTLRHVLDPARVTYVGLDPLPLEDLEEFPFVEGISERLPFKDGTFTDIVVMAALDHFRDLQSFRAEASRVLTPKGRLHILQKVHQINGPVSLVKVIAHVAKDRWDDRGTSPNEREVPKHLREFTSDSLMSLLGDTFQPVSSRSYSWAWYSPLTLFLTFERARAA